MQRPLSVAAPASIFVDKAWLGDQKEEEALIEEGTAENATRASDSWERIWLGRDAERRSSGWACDEPLTWKTIHQQAGAPPPATRLFLIQVAPQGVPSDKRGP